MPLSIRIAPGAPTEGPGLVRVFLDGSLDTLTAPNLEQQLAPVLEGDVRTLVLDMENLTYISSAGIRVVVGARRTLAGKQGSVVMTRLRPQVEKVFEIVKALPNLQVFRSEQELDAYLSAMQRRVVQGG